MWLRKLAGLCLSKLGLRRFRDSLREARDVRRRKASFRRTPLKIVVGAAHIFQDDWIPTEKSFLNLLVPQDWERYFPTQKIDAILAEHVWEHLTPAEGLTAARICRRYLKPGGYLRIAVPDGNSPNREYIDYVKPMGTGAGADDHKILYDHEILSGMLVEAGFQVRLLEYFDANKRFVFNEWNPDDGLIHRSMRFDERNKNGTLSYTSLIVDAFVPRYDSSPEPPKARHDGALPRWLKVGKAAPAPFAQTGADRRSIAS
jgi:predicted SAM-dependent methyltransferase